MKHHIVIVYQTVPPRETSHQICRNTAARKIYLQINIPRVSSALQKKIIIQKYTIIIRKLEFFYFIIVFVVLFIMHILRNSQLRKLVSDFKK